MATRDEINSLQDKVTKLANLLLRHVLPVFAAPRGKRPSLIGTALIVEDSDSLYAISARHVLDQAISPGRLYFYDTAKSLRELSGQMTRTQPLPGQKTRDLFDIAVLKLAPDTPRVFLDKLKLPVPKSALIPFRTNRSDHQYLIVGFPRSKSHANPSKKQLKSEPQGFRVVSANEAAYTHLGVSTDTHIAMPLNVESMDFPDGTKRRIADPHGMSGSPVWLLHDERLPNDPNQTPVVGIAIEYHETKKLLLATDIGVALDLISASANSTYGMLAKK